MHSRRLLSFLTAVAVVALAGCGHLGTRVRRGSLPPGVPDVRQVLADLAANDAALRNFKAGGTFKVESPELEDKERLDRFDGSIFFRRPADLRVVGRNLLGMRIFELTCVGKEFLVKTKKEQWYSVDGEAVEGVSWKVSPSDVAKEMFFPEAWAELGSRRAHIVEYDPARQTVTLLIGSEKKPSRKVVVKGPPWDIVHHERLGEDGQVVASTTLGDYHELSGVRFPAVVDAEFPRERTRMTFTMRNIKPNTELDDSLFQIASQEGR